MTRIAYATCRNQAEADEQVPILLSIGSTFNELKIVPMEGPIDLREIKADFVGPDAPDTLWRPLEGRKISVQYGFVVPCSRINRVTVAGGDKPLHPDWVRTIRDQCKAAGVEFVFEIWGEWCPTENVPMYVDTGDCEYGEFHGTDAESWVESCLCHEGTEQFVRVGRKHSGRMLDGREYQTVSHAVPDQIALTT